MSQAVRLEIWKPCTLHSKMEVTQCDWAQSFTMWFVLLICSSPRLYYRWSPSKAMSSGGVQWRPAIKRSLGGRVGSVSRFPSSEDWGHLHYHQSHTSDRLYCETLSMDGMSLHSTRVLVRISAGLCPCVGASPWVVTVGSEVRVGI